VSGSLKAFVKLVRPRYTAQVTGIVAVLSVANHGFCAQSALAVIATLLVSIGVFFLDDAHDVESDKIVHPHRPIPKGLIGIWQAHLIGSILVATGILFASLLSLTQLVFFMVMTAIAISVVFVSLNSVVRAFLTGFIIWALFPFSASLEVRMLLFGLIVMFPHIGGSIAKDFLHSQGDKEQGQKPPPEWSKNVAGTAFLIGAAVAWLPIILGSVNWLYLPPILVTKAICISLGISALKGDFQKTYTYGRIGMFFALIAFLAGQTWR